MKDYPADLASKIEEFQARYGALRQEFKERIVELENALVEERASNLLDAPHNARWRRDNVGALPEQSTERWEIAKRAAREELRGEDLL